MCRTTLVTTVDGKEVGIYDLKAGMTFENDNYYHYPQSGDDGADYQG